MTSRLNAAVREGRSVVLVGPPGIGKSTVLGRWSRSVEPVIARCLPSFAHMAFRPLSHALGQPFGGTVDDVATDVVAALDGRILAVEDAHWADPSTLAVLRELIGRTPFVATSRSRQLFGSGSSIDEIVIPPLDDDEADALARRLHRHLSDERRHQLVASAGGIPLLITHLAHGDELSTSVRDAVAHRIATLPDALVDELGRLAILGEAAVFEPDTTIDGRASGLLTELPDDRIGFSHDLFAEAIESALGPDRLARLRREVVPTLPPGVACHHLLAMGDRAGAAAAARVAATGADPTTRADLLELAVDALGDASPVDLLLEAAGAANGAHRPHTAARFANAVEAACTIGVDVTSLSAARLHLARAAWLDGEPQRAEEILDETIRTVTGLPVEVEAALVVERAFVAVRRRVGDPGIIELADHAVETAAGSGIARARALNTAGLARSHTGHPGWRDRFAAAHAAAIEEADDEERLAAQYWLVSALGFYGPMTEAISLGARMVDETERLRARRWHHHFLGAHLVHLSSRGDVSDDRLRAGHRLLHEAPHFRNRAQVELALVGALVDRGELDECDRIVRAGMSAARGPEDVALLACASCEIALARRDCDLMREAVRTIGESGAGFFGLNAIAESAAIHLAFAAPGRLDPPTTVTTLTPVLDVVVIEREAHDRQLAGDVDGAIRACGLAADRWAERGLLRFARRARLAQVEVAAAAGDVGLAVRLVGPDPSGPDDVTSRRRAQLVREISRLRSRADVTPRELEVLDLVGAGLTSRQIAGALGISVSTVDSHVDAAMRRLGARTRLHAASLVR